MSMHDYDLDCRVGIMIFWARNCISSPGKEAGRSWRYRYPVIQIKNDKVALGHFPTWAGHITEVSNMKRNRPRERDPSESSDRLIAE
jgi:hypothetical protein